MIIKKRIARVWLSCVLIFYLSVRFVCIGCLFTGNALTGITGKYVLMCFFIF
jgi:hypothetical protein